MSQTNMLARQQELLVLTLVLGLLGLSTGGLLAARLGEGVLRPVVRLSRMIERIGKGDFSSRITTSVDDPMYDLQMGLNQMAMRLQWGREELEQRVTEATREISLRREQAEAATLAKSRFLAAASHDLRQPTHALGMFIARLGQLPLDRQTRKLVGSLEASAHAMQDLLDGLLDISRLEAGSLQVHVSAFPLQAIFDGLQVTLEPLAVDKELRLRMRPTALWVRSDAALLQRIVMNLAQNALRYTSKGTVLIACRPGADQSHVRIEVWDSGIGISHEHQSEIYKEFYQVANSGRDRNRGLGLGLNIVERSAQLLGIKVALRSALGCGTRFTLTVPSAPVGAFVPAPGEPAALDDLYGVHVLVVEDDAIASDAIQELLTSWGCVVASAQNSGEAMFVLQYGPQQAVVISDYRLGQQENGLQLISRLRETSGYPFAACLMSGDTDAALMQASQDAGLTLLHKPVRPAKLRSLLRRLAQLSDTAGAPLQA